MRFKQILVLVDFSDSSWLALEEAGTLAQQFHADIDLLHVWDVPALAGPQEVYIGAALPPVLIDNIRDQATRALADFAARARERAIPIRNTEVLPGRAYDMILDHARRGAYDLIVIGTHGRKGLSRMFLGSVAERVVRGAPCPVLVARPQPGDPEAPAAERS